MTEPLQPFGNFSPLLFLAQMAREQEKEQVFIPQPETTIAISERAVGFELQDADGRRWLYELTPGACDEEGDADGNH